MPITVNIHPTWQSVMRGLTVQIYNMKMRLSSLLVKFFALIFSQQIKLFNHQRISGTFFFKKFSLYLRD